MKPNIFDYATSELSQDAFLCWLLKWAEEGARSHDPQLHTIANVFVKEVFDLHNCQLNESIQSVCIKRQFNSLDILAIINEKYAIMIEDKVFTSHHSNQLNRYLQMVENHSKTKHLKPLPIYYKIVEQGDYSDVIGAGYKIFTRTKMIEVLSGLHTSTTNDILNDYLKYLKQIDTSIESYKSLPITEWNFFSWQGFYRDLQKELKNGKWERVANARGGFWAFWWKGNDSQPHYWQLEESVLKAKVEAADSQDKREYRDQCMQALLEYSQKNELNLSRPKSVRSGKTMTIAQRLNYIQVFDDQTINFEQTVLELKRCTNFSQAPLV
ncbi:PD-(D/E)XK nuclease family protein [Exiguobacterium acetylicum]|uniref:PD-(D/E)XK nuclease family protein n=1 Tax=Exiguobacterium acetylicum TaxID=41170 RepID=UPI001CA70CBE|nr:PD-(D/E)XK nuclease family protein [Exiguobacterium acetylicum]QZY86782.1 PD-(D/E)XK nuclease family protein [Exiguobacterium acetylicum]